MKISGLSTLMQWLGWFISSLIIYVVVIICIVIFLKVRFSDIAVVEYTSPCIIFTFLLLYFLAGISTCFLVSTFFKSPTNVLCCVIFFGLLSYVLPLGIINNERNGIILTYILMLLPNSCLHYGYKIIFTFESREVGAHWHNVFRSPEDHIYDMSLMRVFVMLLFDCVLYFSIAVFVDSRFPGPYGIPYKLNLFGNGDKRFDDNDNCDGIVLRDLKKVYTGSGDTAVNIKQLNFRRGEITVLLGENGAGKTTTLLMLTGMIDRTSGSILINGTDIANDKNLIRRSMGVCCQHNLLFKDLNVKEHLIFFGVIKGLSYGKAKEQAQKLLENYDFLDEANKYPSDLSGGMKRKICLCVALMGTPQVLVLDEPSSGMDPETRRFVWDNIRMYRSKNQDSTVIITTHFMEEAEALGDIIAIMGSGTLQKCDTPHKLESEYGVGQIISITYQSGGADQVDGLWKDKTIKQIEKKFPKIEIETIENAENSLKLRLKNSDEYVYGVVKYLEQIKHQLGIIVSLSKFTLEDLFMKITRKADPDVSVPVPEASVDVTDGAPGDNCTNEVSFICRSKFIVLLRKRWYFFTQTWRREIAQIMPGILLILTMCLCLSDVQLMNTSIELKYTLGSYGKTDVFYSSDGMNGMSSIYSNLVTSQGSNAIKTASVSTALIKNGTNNIAYYKKRLIVAAEFNATDNVINIMYSNNAIHGLPISLNLISNAILKQSAGDGYSISASNNPLQSKSDENSNFIDTQHLLIFILLFPLAMVSFTIFYLTMPIFERIYKMKYLQKMNGVTELQYFGSMYLFDLILSCVYFLILFLFMAGIGIAMSFSDHIGLGPLYLIVIAFTVSVIPYTYILSKVGTLMSMTMVQIISGIGAFIITIAVYVMEESGDETYENIGKYASYVLSAWPPFALTYISLRFYKKSQWNYSWKYISDVKKKVHCHYEYNPCCDDPDKCEIYQRYFFSDKEPFDSYLAIMIVSAVIYFTISVIEFRGKNCRSKLTRTVTPGETEMNELKAGVDSDDSTSLLKIDEIQKSYSGKPLAVNNLSFRVPANTIYGVLGVNGAGKTTLFNILTGLDKDFGGSVQMVNGNEPLSLSNKKFLENIGYCPQEDFLLADLSGRQTLDFFARLNGKSPNSVDRMIENIGLSEHADKRCGYYSGGTKRKLSIGIALIGEKPVVILDEATTGMDVSSRRIIWSTLKKQMKKVKQSSIVMTSHSMDECDYLCDRVMIMKDGRREAEDTVSALKDKYGDVYLVQIVQSEGNFNARRNNLDDAELKCVDKRDEFYKQFYCQSMNRPEADMTLRDHHKSVFSFHISKNSINIGDVLEYLEKLKTEIGIEHSSVEESSLENVFLTIAKSNNKTSDSKKQIEEKKGKKEIKRRSKQENTSDIV